MPANTHFWLQTIFRFVKLPDSKTIWWFLNSEVSTKPTAKDMLKGKTIFINSGVNKAIAIRIFSAEILPASACPRKLLKRENKTNPKRTSETQQMFTIISLLI